METILTIVVRFEEIRFNGKKKQPDLLLLLSFTTHRNPVYQFPCL